jgi:hypothetical protein
MQVSVTTIYKVLSEKYQLRSKWQKNKARGPIPKAQAARQVIQMDTVLFGEVFAFTAIDVFSKESDVLLRPALEATDGKVFLENCMPRRFDGFSEIIQTDGGGEFKGEFSQTVDDYCDRHHTLNVVTCKESKPTHRGDTSTTTFKWPTNFIPTAHNVDTLANQAGRLRWKVENEGFNIQKNGGFNLQHPYSQDDTARKVFYYLLQIAHLLFQLLEKGSLFRQAFPRGVGSLRNIASRLLEGSRKDTGTV